MTTGRPSTMPGPIGALAAKLGGVQTLADAIGITRWGLRHLALKGTWPKGDRGKRLTALCRQNDIECPEP